MEQIQTYPAKAWKTQGSLLALLLLALFVVYYPTFASMVEIWWRSETYAHGFIILPICLWLIWRIRDRILATEPRANFLGIPILVGLGFVWLLASYIGVLAIQQLMVVMMIPVIIFTLLGWQTTSVMLFPLFFLLFCVPLGEELTPYLIDFTANFTVTMIQMVGIPIYREGSFFQLPTGNWSVVSACSGVRYLIASVTLGVLYAYLNYRGMLKRILFVIAALIVPIFANGLRAFMIVMIGHFSDMKLATGVDHIIYGWIFFGIVVAIMFYIGSFWRDEETTIQAKPVSMQSGNVLFSQLGAKAVFILASVVVLAWPIKFHFAQEDEAPQAVAAIRIAPPQGWHLDKSAKPGWTPAYHGMDREYSAVYRNAAGEEVNLFIGYYVRQRQDAELGNYTNRLVKEKDEQWRVVQRRGNVFPLLSAGTSTPLVVLDSNDNKLLVTYFFFAGDRILTNKYETKLFQAKAKLLGTPNDGAVIALSTTHDDGSKVDLARLQAFSKDVLPLVIKELREIQPAS
jgi:exosortase A